MKEISGPAHISPKLGGGVQKSTFTLLGVDNTCTCGGNKGILIGFGVHVFNLIFECVKCAQTISFFYIVCKQIHLFPPLG